MNVGCSLVRTRSASLVQRDTTGVQLHMGGGCGKGSVCLDSMCSVLGFAETCPVCLQMLTMNPLA